MTPILVFAVTWGLLYLLDRMTGIGKAFFRGAGHYAFYNAALLAAMGASLEQVMEPLPPRTVHLLFIIAGVVGIFWGAALGKAEEKRQDPYC